MAANGAHDGSSAKLLDLFAFIFCSAIPGPAPESFIYYTLPGPNSSPAATAFESLGEYRVLVSGDHSGDVLKRNGTNGELPPEAVQS
jgi:hypothetical protein